MQNNLFTCLSLSSGLIAFLCLNGKKKGLLIIAMETVRRAALRTMLALILACNSEANNTAERVYRSAVSKWRR